MHTSRRKRSSIVLVHLLLTIAVVATSCGIPQDDNAVLIPASSLPVELVGGPILPPDETQEGARERFIFMVDQDDILVPVERVTFPNPDDVLEALLNNTTPAERELGISSAIPRGTGFNQSSGVTDGVVIIDLTAGSLLGLGREDREVAFAQIVASLDALPFIDAVNFSIDGDFISVQTSDGTTTPGDPVSLSDFSAHLPIQIGFDEPEESPIAVPSPTPVVVDTRSELAVWMFEASGQLHRVSRRIEISPENILEKLLEGPTVPESEIGFTTSMNPTAVVVAVDIDEQLNTAFVDLTPLSLPPLDGDQKLRAVAQIVYSLTELAEISGVVISIDGVRQAMPTVAGIVPASAILRREDFVELAPRIVGLAPGDDAGSGEDTGDESEDDPNESGDSSTSDSGTSDSGNGGGDATDGDGSGDSEAGTDDATSEPAPVAPTPTPDP